MAWIDYKKAFDSVPQSWIKRCLKLCNINEEIQLILTNQMKKCKTNITLKYTKGKKSIEGVKIRRGIFQRESLSATILQKNRSSQ